MKSNNSNPVSQHDNGDVVDSDDEGEAYHRDFDDVMNQFQDIMFFRCLITTKMSFMNDKHISMSGKLTFTLDYIVTVTLIEHINIKQRVMNLW